MSETQPATPFEDLLAVLYIASLVITMILTAFAFYGVLTT